jgi:two-component system cell cycle sensor histidine kinase/response regulator CckA
MLTAPSREDQIALAEAWAIFDQHRQHIESALGEWLERNPLLDELAAKLASGVRDRLWAALAGAVAGDRMALEVEVTQLGRASATSDLLITHWFELAVEVRRVLLPLLVIARAGEPDRLTASWFQTETLLTWALATIVREHLAAPSPHGNNRHSADERELFERSPLPMWVFDVETHRFLAVNEAAVRHYGYSREEFAVMRLEDIRPKEDLEALAEDLGALPIRSEPRAWRHVKKSGEQISVEISAHAFDFRGRPARLVLINDVTERRQLEAQLRQVQKMDAVGQLAGGVAHDFNNLLTAMLSFAGFVRDDLGPGHPSIADLDEVIAAGRRAAALTRQLLAFSRKELLVPEQLDVNEVVSHSARMLKRLIGEHIDLETALHEPLGPVLADRGQLEQVIVNLAVNARDAMPRGGKLTIETSLVELDEVYVRGHLGAKPGRYVMIAVTDTGTGMSAETQARIFEPFFTTKGPGKGTGLGLSTVFGIVKQSGGDIQVYSALGRGTTFKIYLPEDAAEVTAAKAVPAPRRAARGTETVLLVEDDDAVRTVAKRTLAGAGYQVFEAAGSQEALRLATDDVNIDLLITDVVMPELSGPELVERLKARRPTLRVLFMSGYTGGALAHQGILKQGAHYLQKPFTPELLLPAVRAALGEG